MGFLTPDQFARKSAAERAQLLPLGYHPDTKETLYLPEIDRFSGTYILGVQGVGKSGLLDNMIAADAAAGRAVVVIDPHGDLVDHCLAALPTHRLPQTYVLDMEDEGYPFGLNLFALSGKLTSSIARTQAVERIMHIFEVLWDDVLSQLHLPRYVRAATIVFLDNPGATLVDMLTFLTDSTFRAQLLRNVSDPTVRQFWQSQYEELTPRDQATRIQPLINRLETLFMGRELVRNVVGQRKTTISFRQAIENREIVFIKLPVKTVTQDARLIGTIILTQISAAVFSFGDVPESQRPGVSLYVDEFQHFATPTFSELFTEGRKFGIKVTLAHQYRGQLPDFLRDSTMTARSKVVFQTTPEDGREMSYLFPVADAAVKPEGIDPHPAEYLTKYSSDDPQVATFVDVYLRSLEKHKHGGRIEIQSRLNRPLIDFGQEFFVGKNAVKNTEVVDPTSYLNHLLYEVMKTGNAMLPIPLDAVLGFGNVRTGFYMTAKWLARGKLRGPVEYPAHLVANGRWLRPPEGGREQFYHFLFHLRQTMAYLAKHPVGKKTQPNTSAVAGWLTHLPRRTAFVRSGDDVGMIFTHDTPREVTGDALRQRVAAIRAQTRAKYCHSIAQVQQLLRAETEPRAAAARPLIDVGVPEIAGWGEIGEP